jgi:TATA-binding protein-associated factor
MDADGNAITSNLPTLTMTSGLSPWVTILDEVEPGLVDPAWQARHGSALSVMEIVRYVGSALPRSYLLDLGRSLLTLLVLDRFGDFVGDTVMAPVRETAAQALGVMLKYLDDPAIYEVHSTLVAMVRQPWAKRGKEGANAAKGEKFAWEVRHAGLLGLKYEVAVRSDLLGVGVKAEDGEDVKPKIEENGYTTGPPDLLKDVVESAILA